MPFLARCRGDVAGEKDCSGGREPPDASILHDAVWICLPWRYYRNSKKGQQERQITFILEILKIPFLPVAGFLCGCLAVLDGNATLGSDGRRLPEPHRAHFDYFFRHCDFKGTATAKRYLLAVTGSSGAVSGKISIFFCWPPGAGACQRTGILPDPDEFAMFYVMRTDRESRGPEIPPDRFFVSAESADDPSFRSKFAGDRKRNSRSAD